MIEIETQIADVVFDGRTVTIKRKGAISRTVFGPGAQTDLPISQISSIEWRNPSWSRAGHIRFTTAGSQAGATATPPNRDVNAVLFSKKEMPAFEKLRMAVQDAISQ